MHQYIGIGIVLDTPAITKNGSQSIAGSFSHEADNDGCGTQAKHYDVISILKKLFKGLYSGGSVF